MNRLTHSKNSTILPLFIALALSAVTASASQNLPFRLGDEGTITFTGPARRRRPGRAMLPTWVESRATAT